MQPTVQTRADLFSESLAERYQKVRKHTEAICAPLEIEDHLPQPIAEVSPPKWHLAHTSWFFDAFILKLRSLQSKNFDEYSYLFNSYYEAEGKRVLRTNRGFLSRPTVREVLVYRAEVDHLMDKILNNTDRDLTNLIELGLHHEQQHQELLITDLKYILSLNPSEPVYAAPAQTIHVSKEHIASAKKGVEWIQIKEGIYTIGHDGNGFSYDNEHSRHQILLQNYALRSNLVTNAEYIAFIEDGGYEQFSFWHSDGWDWVRKHNFRTPLYWKKDDHGKWWHYTLNGLQPISLNSPVTHISYYEASAFCDWASWRLPTEFEWEAASQQMDWGQRWEWTASDYAPYPGFKKPEGAVGEYNGKFMINQRVLRGASFATPQGHSRHTYRNFFHPDARWQYTGIRPARKL